MKNKKLVLTVVALLFAVSSAFAQISFNIGAGYHNDAFTSSGDEALSGSMVLNQSGFTVDMENVYYSLGGGTPIFFGVGVGVMENVTFNADFGYWPTSTTTAVDASLDFLGSISSTMVEVEVNQFRFNPGVTFGSPMGLYARAGLSIPLAGTTRTTITDIEDDEETKMVWESKGQFSVGAQTALGYSIPVGENMTLGLEVQAIALRIKSKSDEMVEYSDPDGTKLTDIPVYNRQHNYVDNITEKSNNDEVNVNYDETKPMDDFADRSSFGSWGFNVRFAYTLGSN